MSEIANKSVETFAVRIAAQAVAVVGSIVVARALGPAGKGLFTYAASVLAMVVVVNGQSAAIAWQYAKRKRPPATLLRLMLRLIVAASIPFALALVLVAWLVPGQQALIFVAIAAPIAIFLQSSSGFFLADADVRALNWQQLLCEAGPVLVYVPLLLLGHGNVWGLMAVWIGGYAASALYTAFRLRPYARMEEGDAGGPLLREQLAFTSQVSLSNAAMFLNLRIDVFLIMFVLGKSALGIYSVGLAIAEMLWQVSRPMVTASFGRISRGNLAESAQATATCVRHCLALATLGAIAACLLAPVVVPLLYGKAFAPAILVTQLLLPGIVAYSAMGALSTFFSQQLSDPRVALYLRLLSAVVCAAVTALALPRFGIVGGAIGTSASYLIMFGLAVAQFCKRTGIPAYQLFALTRGDLRPYRDLLASARKRLSTSQA